MRDRSRVGKLIVGLLRMELGPRLLLGAVATALPFYFAAFLSYWITQTATLGGLAAVSVHAVVVVVLTTTVVFAGRYVAHVYQERVNTEQARIAVRLLAYAQLDRIISRQVRRISDRQLEMEGFLETYVASRGDLQDLVEAAYVSLEAAYGQSARTEDRIDFEVTFMTRSYQDGEITIPACANRDGRAPRSMVLRKQNSKIYDGTVTAGVYREARPSVHIIEDTSDSGVGYQELYPDQTRRIRSSIIFPVLSDTNEVLGTLVVHCDRTGFFRRADEKYWTDLLEIFAKRLAVTKKRLDNLAALPKQADGSASFQVALVGDPLSSQ
jgi:hypothetical protein